MRKLLWLIVAIVLLSNVSAQDFSVEFSPGQQTIGENDKAEYSLLLYHDYKGIEFFEVYSPEVLWDIRTNELLQVRPSEPFTTILSIQPLNINPGLYGVPIHVKRSGTNEVKKALLYMEVTGPPSTHTYLPAVRGTVEIPAKVDPRKDVVITVNLENQNRRNLSDLSIKVRSNVINQDFVTNLGPLERKTARFITNIDPQTRPQRDALRVTVVATEKDRGYQFDLPPIDYEIPSYGQITPTIEIVKSFLRRTRIITLKNDANVLIDQPFAFKMPWYTRIFSSTDPDARVENGNLVWDVQINVGNSREVRITTNFRPAAIILLLAIIAYIAYLVFRSPIVIRKSAHVLSTREGGISELKILLEVKNRTNKPVRDATIIDLVPRIAELIKEYDVGTLTPKNVIRHERKGTILKYEVGDIMPHEERVISYQVKSSLSILGGVSLPEAVARFVASTGKERTTSSNKPKVNFLG